MSNPSRSSSNGHVQYSENDDDEENEMLSFEDDPLHSSNSSSRIGYSNEDSVTTSLLGGNSRSHKKLQGVPKAISQNKDGNGDVRNTDEKESFWWIRQKEQGTVGGSPQDWRLSRSSVSTIYHSAQDLTDYMSEISTNSGETLRSQQSYHSVPKNENDDIREDPDDIFSSPPDSPVHERKTGKSVAFSMPLKDVDFVLVWDSSNELTTTDESKERREIFERNLEEEGLVLEHEKLESSNYNFVKIHAPNEVLRRYSEILKLKMKMRDLGDDVVEMIYSGSPEFESLTQIIQMEEKCDAFVDGIKSCWNFSTQWFKLDRRLFPSKDERLSAVYSRDKEYLFDMDDPDLFTTTVRGQIVDFILSRKRYSLNNFDDFAFGIERLKALSVYEAAYPLHDGDLKTPGSPRYLLYREWASLRKCLKYQPLDAVKDYFGVKVALYFAWLGFYTHYLIPASILGLLCFLYGVFTLYTNELSEDICNIGKNITMCPLCDKLCDYYNLAETCSYSRITYLFDNNATVLFAVVMSFWTAIYLEMWKRYSAKIGHHWDVGDFDIHEEHPRPEYLARLKKITRRNRNPVTLVSEPKVPFWKMKLPYTMFSLSMVLFLISMAVAAVIGVVVYRAATSFAFIKYAKLHREYYSYSLLIVNTSAAVINLIFIFFFNWLYSLVAQQLTELELHRTQTQFEDSLTLKMYLLQFINYYSSIFYIAFFKGKFVGSPHKYTTLLGYRQEECAPGGCMTELCLQLAIILIGKQILNMFTETGIPMAMKYWNELRILTGTKQRVGKDVLFGTQWAKDLKLLDWDQNSLFNEYLEMVLQYGFVTIFVAAFPIAPFFALLNNVFEMRLDAKKLISYYRRPVGSRVRDIGVWYGIMDSVGKLAVITNAFIIAFTSNFIPKMVYMYGLPEENPSRSLEGYLDHSLAHFLTSEPGFTNHTKPLTSTYELNLGHVEVCRYHEYRSNYSLPLNLRYKRTAHYWKVWMARLAFIVIFENVVALAVMLLKWIIPDIPNDVREKIRREMYLTNEIIIKQEMARARGVCVGDSTGINPFAEDIELQSRAPLLGNSSVRNRQGPNSSRSKSSVDTAEVMV